jgi:hypothetical protein
MSPHLTVVEVLERVGRRLQMERGDEPIPRAELQSQVAQECGCAPESVMPSDHCYNRTNDGIRLNNTPMFIHEDHGRYRFVGRGYPYTGPLMHYPKGQPPRQVGQWMAGKLQYGGGELSEGNEETTEPGPSAT